MAIVGLCTCLASPLSWTHHYVWVLPLGDGGDGRPAAALGPCLGGAWVVWVSVCLPLAVLPYGGGRERYYTSLQQLVANLGPVMGAGLVVALGIRLVLRSLDRVPAETSEVGSAA